MEQDKSIIYGLEFQARALVSQLAESDSVRFIIGTQSLKLSKNQIHLVELNEENGSLITHVYQHPQGEVWSLNSSPFEGSVIATCYNTLTVENVCCMKTGLWKLPSTENESLIIGDKLPNVEVFCLLDTSSHGQDIRTTEFHPNEAAKLCSVIDNKFLIWDVGQSASKVVTVGSLEAKSQPKFTTGKWNPHQSCTQFVTVNDTTIRSWDIRTPNEQAWNIENAHSQCIRDLDFNPNKQYQLATCGDDCYSKFWDIRQPTEPLIARSDHSHWVWSIRFNHFHDQLVLSSSSDSRVILTSVASISSEPLGPLAEDQDANVQHKDKLGDGLLATYDEHEDSVYSVEWSSTDPWTFASLSYDGRLVINKVPRAEKYKILL